ncbi:MAG TPA: S-layer homology domain-containing protein [Coleofasciculaceae cyanobacterium]
MTNVPPPNPDPSRLALDELIGIVIAFATIGTILGVTLSRGDRGFNLNTFIKPQADNQSKAESLPLLVPLPTATPEAKPLPLPGQAQISPSPFPARVTPLPISPVEPEAAPEPTSSVVPETVPERQTNNIPITVPIAPKAEAPPTEIAPKAEVSPVTTPATPAPTVKFTDVPQDLWARPYIEALATRGIIKGFPDGTFKPGGSITRAEFAALLQKAFEQKPKATAAKFKDVSSNFWALPAIQESVKTGFLQGYPKNVFRPNQAIPKAQVLVALANGLGVTPANASPEVLKTYQDANQIPDYAQAPISAATKAGFVVNYPNPKILNPRRNASRAEVAAMVYQAMAQAGKVEAIPSQYVAKP